MATSSMKSARQESTTRVADGEEVKPPPFDVPIDIRSVALTGLFVLAVLYTLHFAQEFVLPVVLAWVLSSLLAPIVRFFKRLRIPEALSALIIVAALVGGVSYGAYRLSGPARSWIEKAPKAFNSARAKLRSVIRPVEHMQQTTKQLEQMTTIGDDKPAAVQIKKPGLGEMVFSGTKDFLISASITLILLYFLLASGDLFLLKLVKVLPTLDDKKIAVEIYRQIERDVSTYLSVVTFTNMGFGCVIGVAMYLIGLPNPVLWGSMAAVLAYIPYLGALVGITTVTFVAILTFEEPIRIAMVPLIYFGLDTIQANFVVPFILGRRLALNPLVIFIWLTFWGWMWGIIGALLAVPMLAVFKIICDQIEPLAAVGEFLGTETKIANPS